MMCGTAEKADGNAGRYVSASTVSPFSGRAKFFESAYDAAAKTDHNEHYRGIVSPDCGNTN
jgi:hypothetical protein